MIYDDNAARAKYWEDIAKQAFDRIIEQNKIIDKIRMDLDHERHMVTFLQDIAARDK